MSWRHVPLLSPTSLRASTEPGGTPGRSVRLARRRGMDRVAATEPGEYHRDEDRLRQRPALDVVAASTEPGENPGMSGRGLHAAARRSPGLNGARGDPRDAAQAHLVLLLE